MITQTDIAFAAGVFDSEGTIGFKEGKKSATICVRITNTNLNLMKWFKERFGGSILGPYMKGGNLPQYYWNISIPRGAELFLRLVKDYLIEKKEKAEEVIKYCEERKPRI